MRSPQSATVVEVRRHLGAELDRLSIEKQAARKALVAAEARYREVETLYFATGSVLKRLEESDAAEGWSVS